MKQIKKKNLEDDQRFPETLNEFFSNVITNLNLIYLNT